MSVRHHRVTPFLWYDGHAEEAARHYVDVFKKGSRLTHVSPMSVSFELEGQPFMALNGGPMFKFTEAFSLFVDCATQREVDYYWERLGEGGAPGRCGWLKDRWGLSWQVVPRMLFKVLGGSDKAASRRAMEAMLGMNKLSIAGLRAAYDGSHTPAAPESAAKKPTAAKPAANSAKAPRKRAR